MAFFAFSTFEGETIIVSLDPPAFIFGHGYTEHALAEGLRRGTALRNA